ncbi:hypothetical protein CLAFUW4_02752 [Fulvia fulva]|uniref:Uncharacterized protein n=1 Tax=Passalora fulva TaxID=5499 RepID=A0A9Q8LAJ6_PASFU|nr:uncharacterized protein CLAFUR5_02739 [Fulvia fulva]KAK4633066.1 hypothetical protein CLAFUR0_02749 [Fulvia fulva]UJO13941.1 hypothetical protein CLAFUR5_02739 [Fulvia fulva]WPV11316.1 hypothetical protein CLAFUW4_02752 [Fulvia fulva]
MSDNHPDHLLLGGIVLGDIIEVTAVYRFDASEADTSAWFTAAEDLITRHNVASDQFARTLLADTTYLDQRSSEDDWALRKDFLRLLEAERLPSRFR